MNKTSRLEFVGIVSLGLCALAAPGVQAQQALDRVVVTGSHVQRVAGESPTAVQVITAREIERSGAASLAELFRQLPAFSAFNVEADAFVAPERATVSYRGLEARDVLVLLNGRRLVRHAVEANEQLVDVTALPLSAIDRIEVLKDGAGALYGSDAVAGVINVVLKKNAVGKSLDLHHGQTQSGDGRQDRVGASLGLGDVSEQGYNLLLAADYARRSPILRRDRAASARRAPSTASFFSEAGNLYDQDTFAWLGTLNGCQEQLADLGFGPLCPGYPNDTVNLVPGQERGTLFAAATVKLGPAVEGFVEWQASRSSLLNQLSGSPGSLVGVAPDPFETAEGLAIAPGTPLLVDVRYAADGIRRVKQNSRQARWVAGLDGRGAGLNWSVDAGHARLHTASRARGFFDFAAADAGGFDPLAATQALIDALAVAGQVDTRTSLTFGNAKALLDTGALPGGPSSVAFGLNAWRETLSITPDAVAASGRVSGSGLPVVPLAGADREVASLFGELSLPMHPGLQTQVALRHDRYSDFGHVTTPKLAAKWTLVPALALRASVGRGFVAPDLEKLHRDGVEAQSLISDGPLCSSFGAPAEACTYQVRTVLRASPQLQPETSRNLAFGLVATPLPQALVQLDWFHIAKRNKIDTILQFLIDNPGAVVDGRPASSYYVRDPGTGQIVSAEIPHVNVGRETTSGVELEASYRFASAPWGRVSLSSQGIYLNKYSKSQSPGGPQANYLGLINRPRWRHVFGVQWQVAAVEFVAQWRSIGRFRDAAEPGEVSGETRRIGTWTTLDWQLAVKDLGPKGSRLLLGMRNALDKAPAEADRDPNVGAGFATTHSAEGRYVYLGYSVAF